MKLVNPIFSSLVCFQTVFTQGNILKSQIKHNILNEEHYEDIVSWVRKYLLFQNSLAE